MQLLINYHQVSPSKLLILTTKKLILLELTTLSPIHQFSSLCLNQSVLALVSNFDLNMLPIMIAQGRPGMGLDLKDVMEYGMQGELEGSLTYVRCIVTGKQIGRAHV